MHVLRVWLGEIEMIWRAMTRFVVASILPLAFGWACAPSDSTDGRRPAIDAGGGQAGRPGGDPAGGNPGGAAGTGASGGSAGAAGSSGRSGSGSGGTSGSGGAGGASASGGSSGRGGALPEGGTSGGAAGAGGTAGSSAGSSPGGAAGAAGTAGRSSGGAAGTGAGGIDAGSSGGRSGAGGAAGAAGTGGAAGDAGNSEACRMVQSEYATELATQVACDPTLSRTQCAGRVPAGPGCDCRIAIEPKDPFAIEHLANIEQSWFQAGCSMRTCPMPCPPGTRAVCQTDAMSTLGGRCVMMP